jgi:hypothetical protein
MTTEVHDFATGLNYVIEKVNRNCEVKPLTAGLDSIQFKGNEIKMKDPQAFFDLNDSDFQYVGKVKKIKEFFNKFF